QDPDLQRTPVVGVVFVQPARPRKLRRQRLEDLQRAVARAVLGEDQLVLPAERVELAAELGGGFPHDARLVVDGDDDRNHAKSRAPTSTTVTETARRRDAASRTGGGASASRRTQTGRGAVSTRASYASSSPEASRTRRPARSSCCTRAASRTSARSSAAIARG